MPLVADAFDDLQLNLTPAARDAVNLAAKLWGEGELTQHCREAVRTCLSLGVSRSDIAFHIHGSVCMSRSAKNKSIPLISQIHGPIVNIAKTYKSNKSGTAVNSVDAAGKSKCNRIEGLAAKSKSVSLAPSKKRDLNKPGVLEEGQKKAKSQTNVDSSPCQDGAIPPTQGSSASSTVGKRTKTKFPSRIYHPDARAFHRINTSSLNENACPFREIDILTTEFDSRYMYM